jgi:F0F1-type ATP synthase assembly protein I
MVCGLGLDNLTGTGHLFTVVAGILGAAGGFLALYRKIMRK